MNAARLLPHELQKRSDAFSRALGYPPAMADRSAMAGVNSTPVAAISPVGILNLPDFRSPPACESPAVFSAGVVCVVDYETARRWAVAQGLCKFRKVLDLVSVNALRRKMHLLPFALKGEC